MIDSHFTALSLFPRFQDFVKQQRYQRKTEHNQNKAGNRATNGRIRFGLARACRFEFRHKNFMPLTRGGKARPGERHAEPEWIQAIAAGEESK